MIATAVEAARAESMTLRQVDRLEKRDGQEFEVKTDTLSKLQQAAQDVACRLIYFDQSGFSASAPVQHGWAPVSQPHRVSKPAASLQTFSPRCI